jgi:hypothetical protein
MRLLSCVAFVLSAGVVAAADDFKPEPGFKLLFNGKNLDGWQQQTAKKEPLEGKTEAFGGRFKVKDGELILDPSVKGDVKIETTKEFGKDVTIRFEFKPDEKCNNDLFLLGTKFDITLAAIKNAKKDDWNTMEVVVKDGKAEFKCNGEMVRSIPTKGEKSTFAIRAEFGTIVIRKLRASEGK